MLTYSDGVFNEILKKIIDFHKSNNKIFTLITVQPSRRFVVLLINNESLVESFHEKRPEDIGWINGGFFVCQPEVFDFIKDGDKTIWERDPLETLARDKQLLSYKHPGFWRPMDSLKDKMDLNELWNAGKADWKIWK